MIKWLHLNDTDSDEKKSQNNNNQTKMSLYFLHIFHLLNKAVIEVNQTEISFFFTKRKSFSKSFSNLGPVEFSYIN